MSNVTVTQTKNKTTIQAFSMDENELIEVLQTSLYPGAMIGSIKLVINYCKASGLDPMQKPVHIVPMWDSKARQMRDVVMPGIGLYRTQAARSGEYAGVSEPEFGEDVTQDIGGQKMTFPRWCRVTVRRLLPNGTVVDFTAKELWVENYATKGKDSQAPNAMWTRRPYAQLAKCAEAQALRKAFPEFGAQPTADEMEGREIDMGQAEVVTERKPESLPQYTADEFAKNLAAWKPIVESGRATPEQLIARSSTKYTLTADQAAAIHNLAKPANVDSDGVIDAEFTSSYEAAE